MANLALDINVSKMTMQHQGARSLILFQEALPAFNHEVPGVQGPHNFSQGEEAVKDPDFFWTGRTGPWIKQGTPGPTAILPAALRRSPPSTRPSICPVPWCWGSWGATAAGCHPTGSRMASRKGPRSTRRSLWTSWNHGWMPHTLWATRSGPGVSLSQLPNATSLFKLLDAGLSERAGFQRLSRITARTTSVQSFIFLSLWVFVG